MLVMLYLNVPSHYLIEYALLIRQLVIYVFTLLTCMCTKIFFFPGTLVHRLVNLGVSPCSGLCCHTQNLLVNISVIMALSILYVLYFFMVIMSNHGRMNIF